MLTAIDIIRICKIEAKDNSDAFDEFVNLLIKNNRLETFVLKEVGITFWNDYSASNYKHLIFFDVFQNKYFKLNLITNLDNTYSWDGNITEVKQILKTSYE